ncbi:MAG: hydrolase [Gallionellales bacterium RIFCSPLOWO2_02_FULL_57_47]|nr:MAG: hydrolase [Gallionellales bacterium RIFCSPLOWO2_02_FULL_57_47]OGT09293.1 MAG: hydrolase [Gallionellales bacterium RIFCSPHIGHO2_02_FULL_57_16]
MKRIAAFVVLLGLLGGCATREPPNPAYYQIEPGNLPPADITLNIPGLGPCTDNPDRSLHLNSGQPINVLTHGCFGSSGQFRGLAQVLAFHGQQTACFTYDDRAALTKSATELRNAVNKLSEQTLAPQITVIGHSQGALIARRSLTDLPVIPPRRQTGLRLVTISGPFDGIASAETCGKNWLSWLSFGLLPVSCYVVTGAKWMDITYSSRFIREPGVLVPHVGNYLKIDTDERNTCRREEGGRCLEDDDVFSLAEQHNPLVENDARARRVEVRAGHVEIVGDKRVAPTKLIAVLQEQGVLLPTAPERLSAFSRLLARVYQDDALLNPDALKIRVPQ